MLWHYDYLLRKNWKIKPVEGSIDKTIKYFTLMQQPTLIKNVSILSQNESILSQNIAEIGIFDFDPCVNDWLKRQEPEARIQEPAEEKPIWKYEIRSVKN